MHQLLLADDDTDDCIFFREALEELPLAAALTIVNDGVELMDILSNHQVPLPDVLFLDLNMPRKTGIECLAEIKLNDKLKHIPVVIFSTSFDMEVIHALFRNGANYYVRKPGVFSKLKKVIHEALSLIAKNSTHQPPIDQFILHY
jgi:CheY-like chemotaxis protein